MSRNTPRRTNGSPIAAARLQRGMTQSDLAMAIGVCAKQISAWENGRFNIPAPVLTAIAKALGVEYESLIIQKNIRSNIGNIRRAKGMTQAELAKAIGISQGRMSCFETSTMPSFKMLKKIAEVLNVSIEELRKPYEVFDSDTGP